ncbi:MAG: GTPase HflX [Firmicutes bacterium HGW-Firmicutes-14]|nr:MAG: GTPase HflX [Firmicutes bacterium HGW-Firmicutes-14]
MPKKIAGNLSGIKEVQIDQLQQLFEMNVGKDRFVSPQILSALEKHTGEINREIAVYINRQGRVVDVSVGDSATVKLAEIKGRRSSRRLSGIRCIHTHPGKPAMLSDVDLTAMESLNLDAMAAVSICPGREMEIYVGMCSLGRGNPESQGKYRIYGPYSVKEVTEGNLMDEILLNDRRTTGPWSAEPGREEIETAILVAVQTPVDREEDVMESLEELAQLAHTAGVGVTERLLQARPKPDVATYIGGGKVDEISLRAQVMGVNVLIFDDELSPAQQRNLEERTGIKIIDRTALILDIFAQRARTMEGKLQVELAQLNYLLPRLTGKGVALSRLGGGIGTRGPGETKLEVDRRRIRKRISDLKKELEQVRKNRELHRIKRKSAPIPVVSLCGYTNSGKSTLLNRLTDAGVLAEDKLFATLDPTTRKLELPDNRTVLISDTVGFINKIPHHLVAAFRATLEEVVESDVLIHVADISHPAMDKQVESVQKLLMELDVSEKPAITVFNKADRLPDHSPVELMIKRIPNSVLISAKTGEGIAELLKLMSVTVPGKRTRASFAIPYHQASLAAELHDKGRVLKEEYMPEHILIMAELDEKTMARVIRYKVEEQNPGGSSNVR